MVGSSGLEPEGKQLKSKWKIEEEGGQFYIRSPHRAARSDGGGGSELGAVDWRGGEWESAPLTKKLEGTHYRVANPYGVSGVNRRSW